MIPGSTINTLVSAIYGNPMFNYSNIGYQIPRLKNAALANASSFGWTATNNILTFGFCAEVESDFSEMAFILANASPTETITYDSVTMATIATIADRDSNAPFASPLVATFDGGAATSKVVTPATVLMQGSEYFPNLVRTDFMPIASQNRTDIVGGRPLICGRVSLTIASGTSKVTAAAYAGTGNNINSTTGTDTLGRRWMSKYNGATTSRTTGTLTGLANMRQADFNPIVGIAFKTKTGNVMTMAALGDSITYGTGSTTVGFNFSIKSVHGVNNSFVANNTLKSPKPLCLVNLGWPTTQPAAWLNAYNLIRNIVNPTLLLVPNATPNGGDGTAFINNITPLVNAANIYMLTWGQIPYNGYDLAADNLRKARNTASQTNARQYLNFSAVVGDGASPERFISGLNADLFHLNDTGDSAIVPVLQPALLSLVNAYYS